jgi:hypothetical protein
LELSLTIADRTRVFNGIVASDERQQLFTGKVVFQPKILIGLIVSGVAVFEESFHALEEGGANIPRTTFWMGESKIGSDEQTLV